MNITNIVTFGSGADTQGISQDQSTISAGNLLLNGDLVIGGTAILNPPQRIILISGSDISSATITVTGTDANGNALVSSYTGINGTPARSTVDYATITSIYTDSALADIVVGTSGINSSKWYLGDYKLGKPLIYSAEVSPGASLNYTIEFTLTNLDDQTIPFSQALLQAQNSVWYPSSDSNVVGATTSQVSNFINAPVGVRCTINSWSSGTVTLRIVPASSKVS